MKSSFTMDSKYQSEGRQGVPRRRVATKTHENHGDNFEMELSLAIKESLKYAKEKEGRLKRVDKTSTLLNGMQSDESFTRMAGKVLTFATSNDQGQGSEEVQQLKDLLLLHIELIQHQQELLANKDKEISALRNEKDTLQCRLQKAEKRVAHMKQKELLEAQIANAKDVAAAATSAEEELLSIPVESKKINKAEPVRRRKRETKLGRPPKASKVRKLADADKASGSTETSYLLADSDVTVESESLDSENEENGQGETSSSIVDSKTEDADVENEDSDGATLNEEVSDPHPEPVLRTECLFHVTCCVEVPPDEFMEVLDEKDIITGDQVETPEWRINILTNRYQLEGTENITDEAYQKRHQKYEMEEKRRKRWDIQRMREQRIFEKLRGKEAAAAAAAQNALTPKTFLPNIDNLTHIEVSDTIVVMAFGQPVPHIEPSEFELPWDTGPSSSFTRKSHGGRGRQK